MKNDVSGPLAPLFDVAMVGVGNMGGAMMARLCEAGRSVVVCDTDPVRQQQAQGAGAVVVDTPRLAAQSLRPDGMLVVCVVDAAQSRAVLLDDEGAADAMVTGQAVLLCPTISPQDTEFIARALAVRGIDCLDAPLSGGPVRARDGSMSMMIAGAPAAIGRHMPLLEVLSRHRFLVGERAGDGARTKLVNNLLAAINLAGAAEAMAMAERLGLDASRTLLVIEQSSGQSWIGSDRMRRALQGDAAPRAHMTLLGKDTALAVAAARQAGFDGPLGPRVAALFGHACAQGLADQDDSAMWSMLRAGDLPAG